MKIAVQFVAQARVAAGTAAESVDLGPPHTVEELLKALAERHGEPLRGLLLAADGRIHPSLVVLVGEVQVRRSEARELRADDVVCLLTPISGG